MALKLLDQIFPGYIVASLPLDSREDAQAELAKRGNNCTIYFCQENGKWYILAKQQ